MNNATLKELGKKLEVSEGEVRALKKAGLGERVLTSLGEHFLAFITLLSGIQGLSLGLGYAYLNRQSYPARYEPPGGWLAPIFVFSTATLVAGTSGRGYVRTKGGPDMDRQLSRISMTMVISIFLFIFAYVVSAIAYSSVTGIMYGVYSKENDVTAF